MFFDDAKKNAMTILSKRKASGERTMKPTPMKPEHAQTEPGEVDGKHLAAQEMMGAHHEGSAHKYSEALGHFIDMHLAKKSEPEKS